MKIIVKNLVCPCCIVYIKNILNEMGLEASEVSMAGITLSHIPSDLQMRALEVQLKIVDLEIVAEKKNILVEQIKCIVRNLQQPSQLPLRVNLSTHLSEQLMYNYSYLSNLFSEAEGITIRDYAINLRIELVKQMLMVEELDLMEISCRLHYSSVSHLAAQFKQVTGFTSSEFKRGMSLQTCVVGGPEVLTAA